MIFKEERFPEDISYGSTGGPQFSTNITELSNGYEYRQTNWIYARMKYNIAYTIKSDEQLIKLLSFFYECQGKSIPFRFKDWLDYKVIKQLIALGNGSDKNFQLIKTYGQNNIYKRVIKKPVINTVTLYFDNKLQKDGFLIDYTNGKIEFTHPPRNNVRINADFEFDIPVRFDTDHLLYSIDSSKINSCAMIPLIEVKL